jgi:hypothetical protein
MKIKPRGSAKPGECCVLGCSCPSAAWGFCEAHRKELAESLERSKLQCAATASTVKGSTDG